MKNKGRLFSGGLRYNSPMNSTARLIVSVLFLMAALSNMVSGNVAPTVLLGAIGLYVGRKLVRGGKLVLGD